MYLYVIACLLSYSYSYAQDPVISLPQGRVVGIKVYSENSPESVEIFFGIPYASPPIGRLRFSPPERHPGWRRTLFAHKMPPRCPEPGADVNGYSEDCLYLNIWTSRRADTKLQPVVVILYSESWARAGVGLPCQDVAAEGVVVVTVAYRLNVFGFFTLKSMTARGNLALLDQYMALLWVKENIAAFGGDSSSVTLIGHTAGADSILYHIFSPRAIGLFHRVVIMSPQYTSIWKAIDNDKDDAADSSDTVSRLTAEYLGCVNQTDRDTLLCMQTIPLERFAAFYANTNWTNAFYPTPDKFLPQSEQYLPYSLSDAIGASKTPNIQLDVLLGTTALETIYYNNYDPGHSVSQSSNKLYEHASTTIIPDILKMLSLDQSEAYPMLLQAIQWEYFDMNTRVFENNILKAVESVARMETSAKWGAGSALLAARLARRTTRLYLYHFIEPSRIDLRGNPLNFTEAVHGSDLLAFLGDPLMHQIARRRSTDLEKEISMLFRKYMINFIKYGSPSSENEWPRYIVGDSSTHSIYIKKQNTTCPEHKIKKEIAFWLQYLPRLSQTLGLLGKTERITSDKDDSRLRGGVFAMCGVSAVLILLLFVSVIILHRRNYRAPGDNIQTRL